MSFFDMFKDKEEDFEEDETEQELQDQIRFSKQVEGCLVYTRQRPNPKNIVETARWSRENRVNILGK